MKRKITLFIVFILIIAIGVCGCMEKNDLNKEEVTKELATFLAEKYQCSFKILEVYQEFDGDFGKYFRALCCSDAYEDTFTAYCYESNEEHEDVLHIDGIAYYVEDKYVEVLLQNLLLDQLGDYSEESMFVRCKVNFVSEQPDAQTAMANPKSCITETKAYIRIYIITSEADPSKMQDRAESLLKDYNPYTGYVYAATKTPFNLTQINDTYTSNQHDFGNYLTNKDWADRVVFSLYNAKDGLQERKVVKE